MATNNRHDQLDGRFWPTDSMRPGESVSQWVRRMNSYSNAPMGVDSELREGPEDGQESSEGNNRRRTRNPLKVPRNAIRRWLSVR